MEVITFLDSILTLATSGIPGQILNALSVVLGLGMVIFFHELGHFAVAKWCDVHVERFSIGIGPIIWSHQRGETEYALSALPLGGYVKMLGQDDMDPNQMTSDEIAENPRSYSAKKVWQRMAIISAGVTMNVITGFMFFALAYSMGVVEPTPMVGGVSPGSPAWQAGIRAGDVITNINGDRIENFVDINQAVVLSSGSITVKGQHADGSDFSASLTPEQGKTVRLIGVVPARTTRIPAAAKPEDITMVGLPAHEIEEKFQPGDKVTAVNGQPVDYLHEMVELTARAADEDIVYHVQRSTTADDGTTTNSELDITVPPRKMKTLGLWMAIGPVTSLAKGSLAEQQGLKIGDLITDVGELKVGKGIDPLRLPNFFAEHAGEPVQVIVNRPKEGQGNETVTLTLTPSDAPGWSERPGSISGPLTIPAIGAGIRVLPRIAHIEPEGPAGLSGAAFAEGQKITKVELLHPDPSNITPDVMGGKASDALDFEQANEGEEIPGEPNWAFVFSRIQTVPNRQVRVYVGDSAQADGGFDYLFEDDISAEDWYLPIRGISEWEQHTTLRKAETLPEAFGLGVQYTKRSGINIYMTLKSLFQRTLSPTALSGPLGIVKIGYHVANRGTSKLLMFLGFLSINLAVLNFLPIPVLDGGHMVFLIWEAVARNKPSPRIINFAHGLGLLFIISLFGYVLYLDIFVNWNM